MDQQVRKLVELAEDLGDDEQAVLVLVAERLRIGRERYGNLKISGDPRNFAVEALEEAADGLVYAATALIREQGRPGL